MVASLLFSATKDIKINTNNELYNKIAGGNHLIYSLLPIDTVIKFGYCLFKHNIIYLEQLTSNDNKLLSWKQIVEAKLYRTNNNRLPPRTPNFFKKIEIVVLDNNDRIIHPFLNSTETNKPLFSFSSFNLDKKEIITVWNPIIETLVFGQIIDKRNYNTSLV